jgi:predicted ATPase with chaperone activity
VKDFTWPVIFSFRNRTRTAERQFCKLPEEGQSLMRAAMTQLNLLARAYHRTLRVKLERTIAALAGCEAIQAVPLAEALHASRRPKLMLS